MKAYKGFDKNLRCDPTGGNPFQYEIGKEYEEDEAVVCSKGFHACENPLDVMNYYAPGSSRYCEVEMDGDIRKRDDSDTKVVSKRIKIGAEIGIRGIIQAGVRFVFDKVDKVTEDLAYVTTTGNEAHAATTGNEAHAATTGDWAHAVTTGDLAHAATTGNRAHAVTTGDWAHAVTTGNRAHAEVKGKDAIAASLGIDSMVCGEIGCWLVCAEWGEDENGDRKLHGVFSAIVDGEKILPGVWYTVKDGEFVKKEN